MIACALLPAAHRARDPPYRQLPSCIGTLGLDGQAQALDLGHLGLALGLERGLFGIEAADKGFHLGALGLRCTGHTRPSRPPPPSSTKHGRTQPTVLSGSAHNAVSLTELSSSTCALRSASCTLTRSTSSRSVWPATAPPPPKKKNDNNHNQHRTQNSCARARKKRVMSRAASAQRSVRARNATCLFGFLEPRLQLFHLATVLLHVVLAGLGRPSRRRSHRRPCDFFSQTYGHPARKLAPSCPRPHPAPPPPRGCGRPPPTFCSCSTD